MTDRDQPAYDTYDLRDVPSKIVVVCCSEDEQEWQVSVEDDESE